MPTPTPSVMKVAGSSAVLLSILVFMGNGIVANENRNVKEHTEIRKEIVTVSKDARESIDRVKDIVTDIRLEQREISTLLKNKL